MAFSQAQKGVALGMAAAVLCTIAVFAIAPILPLPGIENDTVTDRLAFAFPWTLFPIVCLCAGIAFIARYRFFHSTAINGENDPGDKTLISARAYLENTTEQTLFAIPTWLIFAVVAPAKMVPVLALLGPIFLLARALFAWGYRFGAPARAFGFAATFYPTLCAMVLAIIFAVSR